MVTTLETGTGPGLYWELEQRGHSGQELAFRWCHESLREAKFKVMDLLIRWKKYSKQHSIHAVVWLLLDAFSKICSENCQPEAEWKTLKNVQFGQKRSVFKVVDKKRIVLRQLGSLKRNQTDT